MLNLKDFFPFSFIKKIDTSFTYEGVIPNYELYTDISLDDYKEMASNLNNNWNLKTELIKYCEQDSRSPWLIINKINLLIFSKYNLNIHRFQTLPRLSFNIWLTKNFNSKVPILKAQYNNIKLFPIQGTYWFI